MLLTLHDLAGTATDKAQARALDARSHEILHGPAYVWQRHEVQFQAYEGYTTMTEFYSKPEWDPSARVIVIRKSDPLFPDLYPVGESLVSIHVLDGQHGMQQLRSLQELERLA